MKLPEVISGGTVYDQNSDQYKLITKELAILIGSTNIPLHLVEHYRFKCFVQALNQRYKVPSRTKVSSEINRVIVDMKMAISSYISKARSINLCTDIWTKKGMTAAFLGMTAHFSSIKNHKRHHVTLYLLQEFHHLTIADLVGKCLTDWEISEKKIHRILTDNGSNMVAAFRNDTIIDKDASEFTEEDDIECTTDDDNDDDCFDESLDLDETSNPETVIREYETCELKNNVAFNQFKQTSCFAHTLQLVMRSFDQLTTVKTLRKCVKGLVKKFKKVG